MQSQVIRKPLANILGLAGMFGAMNIDANQKSINDMIITVPRNWIRLYGKLPIRRSKFLYYVFLPVF